MKKENIHTDTLLVVPVILSIWQYAAFFKYHNNYRFFLGTIFVGLGMLTKGPLALVLIGSAVGLHLLLTHNLKAILNYRLLTIFPILTLMILPALWGLYDQFGMEGVRFYFITNNFGRISGSYTGHNSDPFFYIHTTLYLIAPWAAFTFAGIYMQIREKVQKRWKFTETDEFYTLGGVFAFLIISSVAKAKNPHYELVILPLLSILAARWAFQIFEKPKFIKLRKTLGSIHLVTGFILFILSGIFLIYVFPENRIWI